MSNEMTEFDYDYEHEFEHEHEPGHEHEFGRGKHEKPEARPVRRRRWRRIALALGLIPVLVVLAALGISLIPLDAEPWLAARASPELLDREGRTLHVFLAADGQWCMPRELGRISPWLVRATIAAEDQRFRRHPGVDPLAVARAIGQDLRERRIVSGASTLPMQVVKLGGVDSRSAGGKLRQAALALRLVRSAGRDAVLEAYLNKAPYGLNLVGCEAAARRWFGKPAAELTLPEAALLAALPRSPNRLDPLARPEAARRARDGVLGRMLARGMIGEARHARAVAAPLGAKFHGFPQSAPHLAIRLRGLLGGAQPPGSTLDAGVQSMAQRTVAEHLGSFMGEVDSAALLVVDVPTATVLAHVGSPDFFDAASAGQFDAVRAPRSPGSTLKPFTYALAMEQARLYPTERLLDGTLDFGQWRPKNFDLSYGGLVPAGEALQRSLNVPAVTVFNRVGERTLHEFLRGAGLTTLGRPAEFYGLGLTLGNCEARLDEMAAAYTMLASLGEWRPLRWIGSGATPPPARRLLDRGTALALYEMLAAPLPGRPDRQAVGTVSSAPSICWKTGTSTGNRDAWAFVFNANYVVGVWLGNHDGAASKRLVGPRAALPLAARVFHSLPARSTPAWPEGGAAELRAARVCAASGLPVSRWCAHTETVLLPRRQHLLRTCDVHRPGWDGNVVERWPASAREWDLAAVRAAPGMGEMAGDSMPLAASGARATSTQSLRILAPAEGAKYVLTGTADGDRVRLSASLDGEAGLHWFLNDAYLGRSYPGAPMRIDLTAGRHRIVCVGAGGETTQARFEVESPTAVPQTAFR